MSQPNKNVNAPLLWSGLFIGAAVVVLAFMLPSLLQAVLAPAVDEPETVARIAKYLDSHEEQQQTYRDRFEGRSIFFKPRQPVVAPPARKPRERTPVKVTPKTPKEPPPPPPPPEKPDYTGPKVRAILGEQVWFDGMSTRISVGETHKGLTVLSTDPPWTVKVEYRGWEYEVGLFNATAIEGFFIIEEKPDASLPGLMDVVEEEPEDEPAPEAPQEEPAPKPAADDEGETVDDDDVAPIPSPDYDPSRPPAPKPNEPAPTPDPGSDDPEKDAEDGSEKPDAEDDEPADGDE